MKSVAYFLAMYSQKADTAVNLSPPSYICDCGQEQILFICSWTSIEANGNVALDYAALPDAQDTCHRRVWKSIQ